MWQILPYALLTFGEVLVSATGLEFRLQPGARLDEGRHHELLEPVVTVGNLWVLIVNAA
jgi:POT family proton-dependent oligopeptide transporter